MDSSALLFMKSRINVLDTMQVTDAVTRVSEWLLLGESTSSSFIEVPMLKCDDYVVAEAVPQLLRQLVLVLPAADKLIA